MEHNHHRVKHTMELETPGVNVRGVQQREGQLAPAKQKIDLGAGPGLLGEQDAS
jgi:hypothetical protein